MSRDSLRFVFVVQGEGRGHLTQAIVLESLLRKAGHEVVEILVGKSPRRTIPEFFYKNVSANVRSFSSPNFVVDELRRGIKIVPTVFVNLMRLPRFWRSIGHLRNMVRESEPDVVVNFYDFLAGIYYLLFNPGPSLVCIGHQYLLNHPDFEFPRNKTFDRMLIKLATRLTAARSRRNLALSFREMRPIPGENIIPVPPLLRSKVTGQVTHQEDFLLAYIVNDGYAEELIEWQSQHPEVEIHGFWDRKNVPDPYVVNERLQFHQISEEQFIDLMRRCRGYVTTAGFESVCEAMYLGKPVLMVPTAGHFEQRCNAIDATKAGAGIWSDHFDISRFLEYLGTAANVQGDPTEFRKWADSAEELITPLLVEIAEEAREGEDSLAPAHP